MKRFVHMLKAAVAIVVMIAAVGCSKDEIDQPTPPTPPAPPTPPVVVVPDKIEFADSKTSFEIAFDAVDEPAKVSFTASKAWTAAVDTDGAKWLTISEDKGEAGTLEITLTPTEHIGITSRSTVVILTCGEANASIFVSQKPGREVIGFEASEQMIGIDGEPALPREITVVSGTASAKYPGVYWAKEYTEANDLRDDYDQLFFAAPLFSNAEGDVWFSSYYCDCTIYGAQYDLWGGFTLSNNVNTTVEPSKAGVTEQFSAYVTGTEKNTFAAAYDAKAGGMAMTADCCWPQVDFTESPRTVHSIALANSTWTYHFFSGNATDSYVVKVTGMLEGKETGKVECVLISGAQKVDNWKEFDLTALGKVDQLVFAVVSSEPYAPFYFCMDNLIIAK